jgi:hypothetical protein
MKLDHQSPDYINKELVEKYKLHKKDDIVGVALDSKTFLINGAMPNKPYYIQTRQQRVRRYAIVALKVVMLVILVAILVVLCLAYFGRWWQVMV